MINEEYGIETGKTIRLLGTDIRKERTGIHAKVIIAVDQTYLAWTNFNVERDEDRVRLANSAHKNLGELDRAVWSGSDMKHALDLFCARLWEKQIGAITVGPMTPEEGTEATFPCYPFVIDGGGTMIYAPPGRGKSNTALLLAVSIDVGSNSLFPEVQRRRVMVINLERSEPSMKRRLWRVNDALGLLPSRPLLFLNARGKSLHDVIDAARKFIETEGVEVVLLDSVSRAGMGDLNENQPVNRIIDAMNGLANTWIGIAHTPRQDESHIYGSVHFEAGIDVGVQLITESRGDTLGVGLRVTKANDVAPQRDPFLFAMEFDRGGLTSVRTPQKFEFPSLEMSRSLPPGDAIRECLLSFGRATASEVAEQLGMDRANTSRLLNAAPWARKTKEGRKTFFSVIETRQEAV